MWIPLGNILDDPQLPQLAVYVITAEIYSGKYSKPDNPTNKAPAEVAGSRLACGDGAIAAKMPGVARPTVA